MEEFSAQPDRRHPPRYTVDEDATVVIVNLGTSVPARIVEISPDGCRVRTSRRYSFADSTAVEVIFKINGIAFRLGGVMRWAGAQTVGIAFSAMAPRRREAIVELLAELEEEERARVANEAAQTASDPQPAQETKTSQPETKKQETRKQETRKQKTSKQFVVPVVQGAPKPGLVVLSPVRDSAPASPAAASPSLITAATSKPERRGQARHAVDTKATIFLIDVRAKVSGRIVDLSLSGCRIGTDERFPVGIYRRVETEFRLDGLPFRLGGVVQSLHDKFTVGIRFLDMSPRKHDQLVQLIEEIEDANPRGS